LLLANKADPNAKDNLGRTPLQYAAMREDTDMAEVLLANGADINTRGGAGMMLQKLADTPLHEAALNGRKKW
jgi:ankyrin repeat protein